MSEDCFYILQADDNTAETAGQLRTISHRSVWPAVADYVRIRNDEL